MDSTFFYFIRKAPNANATFKRRDKFLGQSPTFRICGRNITPRIRELGAEREVFLLEYRCEAGLGSYNVNFPREIKCRKRAFSGAETISNLNEVGHEYRYSNTNSEYILFNSAEYSNRPLFLPGYFEYSNISRILFEYPMCVASRAAAKALLLDFFSLAVCINSYKNTINNSIRFINISNNMRS